MTAASEPRRPRAAGQLSPSGNLSASSRPSSPFAKLLDQQFGVLSREQAIAFGVGMSTVAYRSQPGGPWQRLLPGVYLTDRNAPSVDQRDMAALLYAGATSLLTGRAALRRYGILQTNGVVDVLVPGTSRPADRGFVRIHRTRRPPATYFRQSAIRLAAIPRAVADAALSVTSVREMRAIVTAAVDRGRCGPDELLAELGQSRLRNGAMLRAVIADVASGIRSAPEGDLMDLVGRSGLPQPLYNPRLYLGDVFLAMPDTWWEAFGVAAEVDSREYHFDEADWESTMQRDARMTAAGIRMLHFTPWRIRAAPDQVIATIRQTLRTGAPITGIRTVPPN